jgi:isopentenyl-diphosphate Delta-isomerase
MNLKLKYLITVDDRGNALGVDEKEACHAGDGIRHHAFLVMVLDDRDRLMLARRSRLKALWPRFWDGTVAGHFSPGEDREAALVRRVGDETGLVCGPPKYLLSFAYEARYEDKGIEKEFCDVFLAAGVKTDTIPLNPAEVSECRFVDISEAERLIAAEALEFTPWFVAAFAKWRQNAFL